MTAGRCGVCHAVTVKDSSGLWVLRHEPECPEPASERCEECDGRGYHVGPVCCGNLLDGDCRGDCAVPERVDCYFCGGSGEAASTAEPDTEPRA